MSSSLTCVPTSITVGATLFYLLTAHPPFEDPDRDALVARVSTATVPSARKFQSAIPEGASIASSPAASPRTRTPASPRTAELTSALRPSSSASLRPAPVGPRVLASAIGIAVPVVLAGFVMGPLVGFRVIRDPVVAFVSVLLDGLCVCGRYCLIGTAEGIREPCVDSGAIQLGKHRA